MAVLSREVGQRLIEIFGLPKGVTGMSIHLDAGDAARIDVRLLTSKEQMDELVEVLSRYELVEREAESSALGSD